GARADDASRIGGMAEFLRQRVEAVSDSPKSDRVIQFPDADDKARRLRVEVERLAILSTVEWMFYVESAGYAERFGVDKAGLRRMVEAHIKGAEKEKRDEIVEKRRIEDRAEKKRTAEERKDRRARQDEERARKDEERARKEAERVEREQEARRK